MSLIPTHSDSNRAVTVVSLEAVTPTIVQQLIEQLDHRQRFEGAIIAGDPPVLGMRVDTRERARAFRMVAAGSLRPNFAVLPWGWPLKLGGMLTLTVVIQGYGSGQPQQVCIYKNDPAFSSIEHGRCLVLFFHNGIPICCLQIDLNLAMEPKYGDPKAHASVNDGSGFFRTQWQRIADHKPILEDQQSCYWESLNHRSNVHKYLTASERLSMGWGKSYGQHADRMTSLLQEVQKEGVPDYVGESLSSELTEFLRLSKSYELASLLGYATEVYERGDEGIRDLIRPPQAFIKYARSTPRGLLIELLVRLMAMQFRTPRHTECGRLLPWVSSSWEFNGIRIDPRAFPEGSPSEDYWDRIPFEVGVNLGRVLSPGDYPMLNDDNVWATFPAAEDDDEAYHATLELLKEAASEKKWTIPPGAILQLPVKPFEYFELYEFEKEVMLIGRTAEGHFGIISVNPWEREFSWPDSTAMIRDEDRKLKVRAGLVLLAAAAIRDFWVMEEREAVFKSESYPRAPWPQRQNDGPRIVYLPRINYTYKPDIQRCGTDLNHQPRRSHSVRAHLRRSEQSSPFQRLLAERYGLDIPTGYTFVRPHERGKMHRDVIYRSRSALHSLYAIEAPTGKAGPSKWFRFERDVHNVMGALGFTVQHVSTAGQGDHGVDVYASKGEDLEQVNWVIQCKCYKRPVNPSVIRDLIGVLESYPRGTRGMVVTTSRFSSGAITIAEAAQIRLMNGEEFAKLLKQVLPTAGG